MARAAFLWTDYGDGILRTGTSAVAGLGLDQLSDAQPRHRARFAATSAYITVDLGSAKDVDCAALIGTANVSTVRLRGHSADSWGGSVTYDSGVQSSVIDATMPSANAVWCNATTVNARYWRWDLTGTNPMDVGCAPIGQLFRPSRNFAFGWQEGFADYSIRDVNPDTGAAFPYTGPMLRTRIVTFPGFTKAEARGGVSQMDRAAALKKDVLFVEDPDASWLERGQTAIWGWYQPGLNASPSYGIFARTFTLMERA